MDYFESICKILLEEEKYWVRQSYKVELNKKQKLELGKPSLPRPEIDLLAFNFAKNELILFEVKSFFDSQGVKLSDLEKIHELPDGRYKLVTCGKYRRIIEENVKAELVKDGLVPEKIEVKLGLIFGKVRASDAEKIKSFCSEKNWFYWSPEDVQNKVKNLASKGYENEPSVITAKILLR
jgi:hypothetical protein